PEKGPATQFVILNCLARRCIELKNHQPDYSQHSGPEKDRWIMNKIGLTKLGAFTPYTTSQLNILWHNGDTFCVNSTQVCVFEQANQPLLVKLKLLTIGIATQFCNLEQLPEPNAGMAAF
ncbi:conserved hypothetical protein, partial [Trichinella spiralis]|uniref:hypothetical protein n=1 Tax=Trichinella spiralis TaxID=6334 RepID=UPI0001EFD896